MHSLPDLLRLIQEFSAQHPFPPQPAALYTPCDYLLALGGKRLRPALLLMGYGLFRDDLERALPPAWAVELFHNFSLMHDDIMDAAPLRRGQPTVHAQWGTTTAILSGDVMLIYAYRFLEKFDDPTALPALLSAFNQAATEVCEGQQMDISFETRPNVSADEYLRMIELKTAVLLGCALRMGATCAGANIADTEHLYQTGRLAGIAFQIQDDLLDTYGDPAKFGKQVGGDIVQNKKTLLVLRATEWASAADRSELEHLMHTSPEHAAEKVTAVRAIFDRCDIPQRIAIEKEQYQRQAFEHLEAVGVAAPRKALLRSFLEELLVREH